MERSRVQTAAGPRAGACRLRAGSAGGQCLRGGSAASQCRWLEVDAPKPHEQGTWVLRFVPNETVMRADGGRPMSRGLPPAAFGGASQAGGLRVGLRFLGKRLSGRGAAVFVGDGARICVAVVFGGWLFEKNVFPTVDKFSFLLYYCICKQARFLAICDNKRQQKRFNKEELLWEPDR